MRHVTVSLWNIGKILFAFFDTYLAFFVGNFFFEGMDLSTPVFNTISGIYFGIFVLSTITVWVWAVKETNKIHFWLKVFMFIPPIMLVIFLWFGIRSLW